MYKSAGCGYDPDLCDRQGVPRSVYPGTPDAGCQPQYRVSFINNVKKNPALQDSPPAAGRPGDILPFRRTHITLSEVFSSLV